RRQLRHAGAQCSRCRQEQRPADEPLRWHRLPLREGSLNSTWQGSKSSRARAVSRDADRRQEFGVAVGAGALLALAVGALVEISARFACAPELRAAGALAEQAVGARIEARALRAFLRLW